jgi:hypothetical protein
MRQIATAAKAAGISVYEATLNFTSEPVRWNQNGYR